MKKNLTEKGVFNVSSATDRPSKMRTNLYVQQMWGGTWTSKLKREWKEGEELKTTLSWSSAEEEQGNRAAAGQEGSSKGIHNEKKQHVCVLCPYGHTEPLLSPCTTATGPYKVQHSTDVNSFLHFHPYFLLFLLIHI